MNNTEVGDTFNKAITRLAPAALDTLWPEIEKKVSKILISVKYNTLSTAKNSNFPQLPSSQKLLRGKFEFPLVGFQIRHITSNYGYNFDHKN